MLTSKLVRKYHPDLDAQEHGETAGSDFADLREVAWDEVRRGIRQNGWRPALLRVPESLSQWALAEFDKAGWRAGVITLRGDWPSALDAMEYLDGEIAKKKNAALLTLEWVDLDESDSRSDDEIRPQPANFVR